jgi:hypothetical protein
MKATALAVLSGGCGSPFVPSSGLLALPHHIQGEFHSIGNAQFVVDTEQIVTYCVIAETELYGNVFIGETLCDETDYLPLTFSQQAESLRVH